MIEQYVRANCLSCLLNRNNQVEIIPEPFRMQSSVSLRVTYSEYRNYILSLPQDTLIKLCADVELLRNLASTESPKLYNYFLRDIAFAICKEVHYAEKYRKKATVIVPASFVEQTSSVSDCVQNYGYCSDVEVELKESITNAGFPLGNMSNTHNMQLYKLAVVLQALSKVPTTMKEISLVYDS